MKTQPRLERACPWCAAKIDGNVMFRRVKAAALSIRPRKWDKAANADKLESFIRRAARKKPDLIVAPEGFLEGYVVFDVIWHREREQAFIDIAEPLDGPYVTRFRKLARLLKTCLCFGFAERIGREACNTAIFIDHEGRICGKHHKVAEATHPSWCFSRPGTQLRAFDTPLGRCGILICADRWSPITARGLVLDGAQFILIPAWGTVTKNQNATVLGRARENGVPIVEANVGMNLIISKGEIVAYKWGQDQITTGWIDIPVRPSRQALLAAERELHVYQQRLQNDGYRSMMASVKRNKPSSDERRSFVSEGEFRRLLESKWGETRRG